MMLTLLVVLAGVDHPHVRLVEDVPLVEAVPGPSILETGTLPELEREYSALRRKRPGLGLPITLLAVGGGTALAGGTYVVLGITTIGGVFNFLTVIGIVGVAVGLVAVGIGAVLLSYRVADRAQYDEDLTRLRQRIDELKGQQPLRPGGQPPPPQPPPVPQVNVAPTLLLAEF